MSVCLSVSLVVHILGSVSLSLRPNGGCQTIELELCPRVSLLATTSLTFCHRKNCKGIAEILLNRALRGKDQRWCSNLKCTYAPVHQTLHYNHQTWNPVETLGPKWELAKFYGIQTTALPDIQTAAITKLESQNFTLNQLTEEHGRLPKVRGRAPL